MDDPALAKQHSIDVTFELDGSAPVIATITVTIVDTCPDGPTLVDIVATPWTYYQGRVSDAYRMFTTPAFELGEGDELCVITQYDATDYAALSDTTLSDNLATETFGETLEVNFNPGYDFAANLLPDANIITFKIGAVHRSAGKTDHWITK